MNTNISPQEQSPILAPPPHDIVLVVIQDRMTEALLDLRKIVLYIEQRIKSSH